MIKQKILSKKPQLGPDLNFLPKLGNIKNLQNLTFSTYFDHHCDSNEAKLLIYSIFNIQGFLHENLLFFGKRNFERNYIRP